MGEFARGDADFAGLGPDALAVSREDLRLLFVDDGSRDDTPAVLERLRQEQPFLQVVRHRRQRGIAEALRSGIERSRGDLCVFYPAVLQYLPEDIPRLVAPILDGEGGELAAVG